MLLKSLPGSELLNSGNQRPVRFLSRLEIKFREMFISAIPLLVVAERLSIEIARSMRFSKPRNYRHSELEATP